MTWYRHYKGGYYQILHEGTHTENGDELVVYRGQDGRIWIRPKDMFYGSLSDGTKRFHKARDPSAPRWRPIPGWCEEDGRGWQISDCGQIRDTGDPEYIYNDHDEIVDIAYESIYFSPTHIHLYGSFEGKWKEEIFEFTELKRAAQKSRPPVPIRIIENPETD